MLLKSHPLINDSLTLALHSALLIHSKFVMFKIYLLGEHLLDSSIRNERYMKELIRSQLRVIGLK